MSVCPGKRKHYAIAQMARSFVAASIATRQRGLAADFFGREVCTSFLLLLHLGVLTKRGAATNGMKQI